MSATETTSRRGVRRCHCGAILTGRSDHCGCCGCEEHETVCTHHCPHPEIRIEANHANRCW
jgi:hypothetical protein